MNWLSEQELLSKQPIISSWFLEHVQQDVLHSKEGIKLAYAFYIPDNAKQAIVISAGRVESYLKYDALFYELAQRGIAVFSCDHRGQGLSQRISPNRMHGHILDFATYRDDLAEFIQEIVQPRFVQPWLLCHSMGSAIGLMLVQQQPSWFAKVALTAPMLGLKAPLPEWLTKLVLALGLMGSNLLQKPLYFLGQKAYLPEPFADNKLTHSQTRYDIFRQQQQAFPETQLGGVTYAWVAAAIQALYTLEKQAPHTDIPLLCISAGADKIVDNKAQQRIVNLMPNASWHSIDGAYHELLFETDVYRNATLDAVMTFFEE